MTFPNGSGAPLGNKNASHANEWKQAIERALSVKGTRDRAEELYIVAETLLGCAKDTSSPHYQFAVKEIGLRLDGKPREHIQVGVDEGNAFIGIGISQAFANLVKIANTGEVIDAEVTEPCVLTAEPMGLDEWALAATPA